jgi:hypothetical protein
MRVLFSTYGVDDGEHSAICCRCHVIIFRGEKGSGARGQGGLHNYLILIKWGTRVWRTQAFIGFAGYGG